MMKVGLCTVAFQTRPIEHVLTLAAEVGFEGVEIWGKEPHMKDRYDESAVNTVRSLATSKGLEINSLGSYVEPLMPEFKEAGEHALKIARGLGARILRIWTPRGKPQDFPDDKYRQAVCQLKEFCKRAAGVNVVVGLEFHDNHITETSDAVLRLLEDVNAANLKTYWQPSFRAGAEDPYQSLKALLPHAAAIHAQNCRGSYQNRALVSDGDIDYQKVIAMLRQAGFKGYLEIEFVKQKDPDDAVRKDYAFLKALAKSRC